MHADLIIDKASSYCNECVVYYNVFRLIFCCHLEGCGILVFKIYFVLYLYRNSIYCRGCKQTYFITPPCRNSAGYVYLRFDSVESASRAQQAMHKRWFARRSVSAIFLVICLD